MILLGMATASCRHGISIVASLEVIQRCLLATLWTSEDTSAAPALLRQGEHIVSQCILVTTLCNAMSDSDV